MHRRRFLCHAYALVTASLLGWPCPPRAIARAEGPASGSRSPVQPGIALIIDDIGYSYRRADLFLSLNLPLTFSVLPQLPKSGNLARTIQEQGHEIMLHQPMEPVNRRLDPGPGALFVEDSADRIVDTMEANIDALTLAAGVNNHMGSRFTACSGKIEPALEVIKAHGLYFVDSVTSQRSVAHRTARQMGLSAGYNRYFIDPVIRESFIYSRLVQLETAALSKGQVIGIGHPHPSTARALARFARSPATVGPRWAYVSEIMGSAPAPREPTLNSNWFYKTAI
ncbi:MAG: divergent polysaccharide deacetylase family protein [Desulfobacterales bacterium]